MSFQNPTIEEYRVAKMLLELDPFSVDGRELWILKNFTEEDFECQE